MTREYDLAVIGGGPGGAAAAHEASKAGFDRVVILERVEPGRPKVCAGGISPGSMRTLREMGIFDRVKAHSHVINGLRIVSPNGAEAYLRGDEAHVLARDVLDRIVLEAALETGAELRCGTTARRIDVGDDGLARVHTDDGEIKARWVVAADGARNRFNLNPRPPRLILGAMLRFEGIELQPDFVEMIYDPRITPGYMWLFPESPTRANIGFGVYPHSVRRRGIASMGEALLETHFKRRLNGATRLGDWERYPLLTSRRVEHHGPPRTLLVGEATRLVGPATGEGIFYALRSGQIAVQTLAKADRCGWGSATTQRVYAQRLRQAFWRRLYFGDVYCRISTGFLNTLVPILGSWPVRRAMLALYKGL